MRACVLASGACVRVCVRACVRESLPVARVCVCACVRESTDSACVCACVRACVSPRQWRVCALHVSVAPRCEFLFCAAKPQRGFYPSYSNYLYALFLFFPFYLAPPRPLRAEGSLQDACIACIACLFTREPPVSPVCRPPLECVARARTRWRRMAGSPAGASLSSPAPPPLKAPGARRVYSR